MRLIVIEAETPGDSRTMFRLRIDKDLIGEGLTAAQTQTLVGEVSSEVRCRNRPRILHLGRRLRANNLRFSATRQGLDSRLNLNTAARASSVVVGSNAHGACAAVVCTAMSRIIPWPGQPTNECMTWNYNPIYTCRSVRSRCFSPRPRSNGLPTAQPGAGIVTLICSAQRFPNLGGFPPTDYRVTNASEAEKHHYPS
jgi:hypothetical protein